MLAFGCFYGFACTQDGLIVIVRGDHVGADLGVEGSIIVFEDVTSRARLEEQLQISDKMASIGLLAAGVAHEVNTPLTGISSYTQMLLDRADPEDPQTKLLEKIERQTFRAAKIVNGVMFVSNKLHRETTYSVRNRSRGSFSISGRSSRDTASPCQ